MRHFALARRSLLIGMMLSPAGCLVADPPLYQEPPTTPPLFDLSRAQPLPGEVTVIRRTGSNPTLSLEISVPFRSEDRGDEVVAALHLDYNTARPMETFALADRFEPSTFEDSSREIKLTFEFSRTTPSEGCHTLTLLASHYSTWNLNESRPHIVRAENDRAMAVWWLNFDPLESDPYTLRNCPNPATAPEF